MGFLDTLRENNKAKVAAGVVAVLAIVSVILFQSRSGSTSSGAHNRAFFTVDDGATWYTDDSKNLPPFDHDGKTAYRVVVYDDENGKPFAGYLIRYTDVAKKALTGDANAMGKVRDTGVEVKKPGASSKWVAKNSAEGGKLQLVVTPSGKPAGEIVEP